jgi:hypothetical protein
MQMKPLVESMRWVIACLVVLAAWMAGVIYYVILPSHSGRLLGVFFVAIGALNVLFCKTTARKFFAKTQSSPPFVAGFWARSGERGVQLLFLGIGIILAVGGCVLIIVGSL